MPIEYRRKKAIFSNGLNTGWWCDMLRMMSCGVLLALGVWAQAVEIDIASKRYPIEIDGVKAFVPYESSQDLSVKNDSITRVIYAVHSASYNAKSYFNRANELVDKVPGQKNKTLIIAPHLLDKSCVGNPENLNILYWEIPVFRGTSRGFFKDARVTVSGFELIDRMLKDVVMSGNFPNLKTIIILGHSAGGQMVGALCLQRDI